MALPSLEVIVPVLDEERLLPGLLDHLAQRPGWQRCIVVDGGSGDRSLSIARAHPQVDLALQETGGRHRQLNAALARSRADIILLLAADLRLSVGCIEAIRKAVAAGARHGCLRQRSADRAWHFRLQDAASRLRARWLAAAYMDQAPFFRRRDLQAIGGFRDLGPYDSAEAGARLGPDFALVAHPVCSSCRAWKHGFWAPTLHNQRQRLRHLVWA